MWSPLSTQKAHAPWTLTSDSPPNPNQDLEDEEGDRSASESDGIDDDASDDDAPARRKSATKKPRLSSAAAAAAAPKATPQAKPAATVGGATDAFRGIKGARYNIIQVEMATGSILVFEVVALNVEVVPNKKPLVYDL